MNKIICIIPARKNSKRLVNKNTLSLGKVSLIEHSINYAKQFTNIIDEIIISTDDEKVIEIAKQNNIPVIKRPDTLASDTATTVSVLKHVLEQVDNSFDTVILLQPTNPLRPKKLLAEAYKKYKTGNYDSLITVTRNHQKFGKIENEKFKPFNYKIGQRSQDLDPLYFENGLLYITKSNLIMRETIIGENNCPFIVNHSFAKVDIDTQEDLDIANYYLEKYPNE